MSTERVKSILDKLLERQDLTHDEAVFIADSLFKGELSSNHAVAVLIALRMKGESADELYSFASAMRAHCEKLPIASEGLTDIVGTGGDGANTINISTISVFIAAGAGLRIAKHGGRAASSMSGSADVLEKLGVNVNLNKSQVAQCIAQVGIGFMFAPVFHPMMKNVAPIRKELGIRTIFNLLGPLSNPASAENYLLGVYDPRLLKTLAEALQKLGARSAFLVSGQDKLDEVSICAPSQIVRINGSNMEEMVFNPENYGFKLATKEDIKGGSAEQNAAVANEILANQLKGARRDICILNSGFAIAAARHFQLEEGFKLAEESLDSGRALQKLKSLIEMSNSF